MAQLTHSQFEPATLPCRACGQPVEAEVWIIVDVDERPDLLARLQSGALHDFACPGCGHVATLNAPLLIYRPGAEPPLLFSPAHGGDPAQHEEQATALLGLFREGIGDDWRDEWLAHGLTGVARAALSVVLGDDPATAAALATAHAADEEVSPEVRGALETIIRTLAAEGLRIQTAEDLQHALESRPELKTRLAAALAMNNN